MNDSQCYVVGLRVTRTEPIDVIKEMSETPKKFGPHITLKGKFACRPETELSMLREVIAPLIQKFPLVRLSPWIRISNSLVWRECLPKNEGYSEIKHLHLSLLKLLRQLDIVDLTPKMFQVRNYRPHLTVHWEQKNSDFPDIESGRIACFATDMRLVIYSYERDPFNSCVDCIFVE